MLGIVLTAVVSVFGTLVAVGFTSYLRNRETGSTRQREAYESLITSVEILSTRTIVTLEENALFRAIIVPALVRTIRHA